MRLNRMIQSPESDRDSAVMQFMAQSRIEAEA